MVDNLGREFKELKGSGRVYEQPCQQCGGDFFPKKRNTQKYCSEACRAAAYRDRNVIFKPKVEKEEQIQSGKNNDFNLSNIAAITTGALTANVITEFFKGNDSSNKRVISLLLDIQARQIAFHNAILNEKIVQKREYYDSRVQKIKSLQKQKALNRIPGNRRVN